MFVDLGSASTIIAPVFEVGHMARGGHLGIVRGFPDCRVPFDVYIHLKTIYTVYIYFYVYTAYGNKSCTS